MAETKPPDPPLDPRDSIDAGEPPSKSIMDMVREELGLDAKITLIPETDSGTAPQKESSREPGPSLRTGYQLLAEIARGGMGVIYRGHDPDLGRDVAIKVLREDCAARPEVVRRFVGEAQIGGQLEHPGIVPVHELGLLTDRRPFIAMKLVRGSTLSQLLRKRPSLDHDRRRFLSIFEQVCQTVAYAHSRGVVHRDLKPENVMVGAFGEVHVVDWGLAKLVGTTGPIQQLTPLPTEIEIAPEASDRSTPSLAGSVIGTPSYMPPEQAWGEVHSIDPRTDVFALGGILCEILTGKPPYEGDARAALDRARKGLLEDAWKRIENSGADPELRGIARKALEPDPAKRPASAKDLLHDITEYLSSAEERARTAQIQAAEARGRATLERRARKLTVGLATAVVGAVVLGAVGFWFVDQDRRERIGSAAQEANRSLSEARVLEERLRREPEPDLQGWDAALAAVKRADAVVKQAPVGDALTAEIRSMLSTVEQGRAEAVSQIEQRKLETAVVSQIESAALPFGQAGTIFRDPADREQVLDAAFQALGVHIATMPVEHCVAKIVGRRVTFDLASALDTWAMLRIDRLKAGVDELSHKCIAIARRADPDATRNQLRDLFGSRDPKVLDQLRAMAAEPNVLDLPPQTLIMLSYLLASRGSSKTAVTLMRGAALRYPQNVACQISLILVLMQQSPRPLQELTRVWRGMLTLKPTKGYTHEAYGRMLSEAGIHEDGLPALQEAVRLDPTVAQAQTNLGVMLTELNRFPEGLVHLRRAAELAPNDVLSHLNISTTLLQMGDFKGALEAAEKAIAVAPDNHWGYHNKCEVLRMSGQIPEAFQAIDEFLKRHPTSVPSLLLRSRLHALLRRPEEARVDFAQAVSLAGEKIYTDDEIKSIAQSAAKMLKLPDPTKRPEKK